MGVLERLTYLLGIAVAVIGWSVTQLSQSITSDKILGYSITHTESANGNPRTELYIENLSRDSSPNSISITIPGPPHCVRNFLYEPTQFVLPKRVDPALAKDRRGAERITIPNMIPGTSFSVSAEYAPTCAVAPQISIDPGPSGQIRLLELGLQTFAVRNEFNILAWLAFLFSLVFNPVT